MKLSWTAKNKIRQGQRAEDLEHLEDMIGRLVNSIERHGLLLERLLESLEGLTPKAN